MIKRKLKPSLENLGTSPGFLKLNFDKVKLQIEIKGNVYFLTNGKYVKIGFTNDIDKRITALQTSNPEKLELLGVFKGNKETEAFLHCHFSKNKVRGEWFDILDIYNKDKIQQIIDKNILIFDSQFAKVFVSSKKRKFISSLSSRGRSLFLWLIYELEEGKDYVYINEERVRQELNISYNTLKGAIQDLIKEVVIVESAVKTVYWINPLFFFNGSRLDKYKDNIVYKYE